MWMKTGRWKCAGENKWVKTNMGLWLVHFFRSISILRTFYTQKCCQAVLIQVILSNNTKKIAHAVAVLPCTPQAHLQKKNYTCVCVCVCVRVCICVWDRDSVYVCLTPGKSAEICVPIRKLAKSGDLGRVACDDFDLLLTPDGGSCVVVRCSGCSVLYRVAVCCSVLQCVAVCCSVLQCVAVCCTVLHCVVCDGVSCVLTQRTTQVAKCCYHSHHQGTEHSYYEIQNTATYCNILQHTATYCNTLHTCCKTQDPTIICNILQRTPLLLQHTAHYNILQHTAACCNILQHTATYCNILHHTATHCNILRSCYKTQHIITHNTLQHTATQNTLLHTTTHYTLQHTATHCYTLLHTATHYNTLHHTATPCNAERFALEWGKHNQKKKIYI